MSSTTRRVWRMVFAVGLAVMVGASIWAPPQPDLLTTGACQFALCGTLEDPQRWRAAWFVWVAGAVLTVVAAAVLARPRQGGAWRRACPAALVVICLPACAIVAAVVALFTSVHGFATVMWSCGALPLVALATASVRSWGGRTRSTSRKTRREVESP
jgi:hypothetical protein